MDLKKIKVCFAVSNIISFVIILIMMIFMKVPTLLFFIIFGVCYSVLSFFVFKSLSSKIDLSCPKNNYNEKLIQKQKYLIEFSEELSDFESEIENLNIQFLNGNFYIRIDENNKKEPFYSLACSSNDLMDSFVWIMDIITIPIIIVDYNLSVSYVNNEAVNISYSTKNSILHKNFYKYFDIDDEGNCPIKRCFETRENCSLKSKLYSDDKFLEVSYTAIPIIDDYGAMTSALVYIIDYTDIFNNKLQNMYIQKKWSSQISYHSNIKY